MRNVSNQNNNNKGTMLVVVIAATGLFLIIMLGAISLGILQQRLNISNMAKTQALHIAEAGVNYYRWVLYHNNEDFCNSEACQPGPDFGPYGPYSYTDFTGNSKGFYELYITPPALNGSTIVKIKSVGWTEDHPNVKREIEVQCGIPSWSTYSTLSNDFMRFGVGTEIWGPVHSNSGIRFDGLAHNIITSSVLDYDDPDHNGPVEYGVHTHEGVGNGTYDPNEVSDGSDPPSPPLRSDVFMSGRSFPEPVVSFDLLNDHISGIYKKATTSGIVIDPREAGTADPYSDNYYWGCINDSCDEGFHITLKTDNTFDIRAVSSVRSDCGENPSLSILNEDAIPRNYPIPANGLIFIKNNVWVDGQIDNSRVSIFAFREPFAGGSADLIINNDLLYTNYDGSDAIGLIAQRDIGPGLYSEGSRSGADDGELRIDAALIAKSGRIGRHYYPTNCTSEFYKRELITIYGSLSTYNRYGFSWGCGASDQWCSGYDVRNLIYDNNLTFNPPPHYPSTGEYKFISWKEK